MCDFEEIDIVSRYGRKQAMADEVQGHLVFG
jgi:hypothetical protein